MTIPPIAGAASVTSPASVSGAGRAAESPFAKGLEAAERLQDNADDLAVKAATGQLTDVHDFTAAAAKASLAVELTVALRNRAVEAYQEIMRMQI